MMLKRAAWILVIGLLAAEFILAGASKLRPGTSWSRMFLAWGYPAWFRFVVGGTEIVCGIGLVVSRARLVAACVLITIMAGAAVTHLLHGEPQRVILNAALSVLLGILIR